MNDLLKEIYETVLTENGLTRKADKRITEQVTKIAAPYAEKYGKEQMEAIRNDMFGVALISQEEGFQTGIQILVKLIAEMIADS